MWIENKDIAVILCLITLSKLKGSNEERGSYIHFRLQIIQYFFSTLFPVLLTRPFKMDSHYNMQLYSRYNMHLFGKQSIFI